MEHLVDRYKDDEGKWRILVNHKGFLESENTWERPSSFLHGYTTGFRNNLRAHPEIPNSFTDCLSKPDRVIESDGAQAVVADGYPAPRPHFPAHFAGNQPCQSDVRQEARRPPPTRALEGNDGHPVREQRLPDLLRVGSKPAALNQAVVRPHSETLRAHFLTLLTHIRFIKSRSKFHIAGA